MAARLGRPPQQRPPAPLGRVAHGRVPKLRESRNECARGEGVRCGADVLARHPHQGRLARTSLPRFGRRTLPAAREMPSGRLHPPPPRRGRVRAWRTRVCAVRQARRLRALWPLLWRLQRELVGHLEKQLFFLGKQEFLRRWFCRYLSVRDSRIELRFRYLDNL
ncbi:unnamed protein product [Ixodes pacificus]